MKGTGIIGLGIATIVFASGISAVGAAKKAEPYHLSVNTFIGTDFTGNTYPGAQSPFGMVQLSPDNGLPGWDRIAGYFYPDSTIAGFSHTHLSGTGAGDLYDISFLPVTLPVRRAEVPLGIHSRFSHDSEKSSAGYYKVTLADYAIDVELTATPHCGIQRYTFPGGAAAITLNLSKAMNWDRTTDWKISVVDSVTIEGHRFSDGWARDQHLWFRSRFSRPFSKMEMDSVAWFYYDTKPGDIITVSTAISCTGPDGAKLNLDTEVPDNNFDKYLLATQKEWDHELARIEVKGGDTDDRVNFYTALYHAMLAPTIYADVDGGYRGPDKSNHHAEGWTNYGTFSLWDTYRAAHPLYILLDHKRAADMAKSLLEFAEQNGRLPVWNFQGSETDMMIGYHSAAVIADAYLKGVLDYDAEKALALCVATANLDSYRQIGDYRKYGYVPYDLNEDEWALSKTLEYAYDDYCIARMAEKLGHADTAAEFYRRSGNWRNVYNPATGFMQPRDSKGVFIKDFNPDDYSKHICESNAWHYLWNVQHDIPGLIKAMGREHFINKLDSMMTYSGDGDLPIFSTGMIGQYAHGNEPSHHVIYLHNAIGRQDLTQKYVTQVTHELYRNTPAGLCGNEDCGQMSAWFVFSAMGFYPVDPVSGKYEIGSPLFTEVKMRLPNGKTFTVKAPKASHSNIYIKSMKLNGKPYTDTFITYDAIMSGATLELEMASSSNK
jgi:predicted alpha-1,2-mannosidase